MPAGEKTISKQIVSLFVSGCFLLTELAAPGYAFSFPESSKVVLAGSLPADLSQVRIPSNIGKLEEVYEGDDRVVILVQDAHSIPDAQRNIRNLIDFFQREHGLDTVALEGTMRRLNPQVFRSFPDKDMLKDIFAGYLEQGELSGAAMAAIFNREEALYQGVEDWDLYEEGYGYYLETLERQGEILAQLKALNDELQNRKERIYSSSLLEVDKALQSFHSNNMDLMKVLKILAAVKAPPEGSEPALMLEEESRTGLNRLPLETEVKAIAGKMKDFFHTRPGAIRRETVTEFNEKFQAFQTSRIPAEQFALFLKDLCGDMRLPFRFSDDLSAHMKRQKKLQDIEGTRFFDQFERYAKSVKDFLIRSEEERRLDQDSRRLYLLGRLAKMELTREQWHQVKSYAYRGEFLGPNNIRLGLEDLPRFIPEAGLRELFMPHLLFYENAEVRDAVFVENLIALLKERARGKSGSGKKAVLLVAGGFHTEGLVAQLKEAGISYLLLTPAIQSLPKEIGYENHMRGIVSWKEYFEFEEGQVNVYKAFVRYTRDRFLAEARKTDSLHGTLRSAGLLKEWRDQIVRDLAAGGRIAESSSYTRFIDEVAGTPHETVPQDNLLEKVEQFVAGLRELEAKGQLSEQNILRLLQPASIAAKFPANMLVDRAIGWGGSPGSERRIVSRQEMPAPILRAPEQEDVTDRFGAQNDAAQALDTQMNRSELRATKEHRQRRQDYLKHWGDKGDYRKALRRFKPGYDLIVSPGSNADRFRVQITTPERKAAAEYVAGSEEVDDALWTLTRLMSDVLKIRKELLRWSIVYPLILALWGGVNYFLHSLATTDYSQEFSDTVFFLRLTGALGLVIFNAGVFALVFWRSITTRDELRVRVSWKWLWPTDYFMETFESLSRRILRAQADAEKGFHFGHTGTQEDYEATQMGGFREASQTLAGVGRGNIADRGTASINVPAFIVTADLRVVRNQQYFNPYFVQESTDENALRTIALAVEDVLNANKEMQKILRKDRVARETVQSFLNNDAVTDLVYLMVHRRHEGQAVRLHEAVEKYLNDMYALVSPELIKKGNFGFEEGEDIFARAEKLGVYESYAGSYSRFALKRIIEKRPQSKYALLRQEDPVNFRVLREDEAGAEDPNAFVVENEIHRIGRGRVVEGGQRRTENILFARWKGRRFLLYSSVSHRLEGTRARSWRQAAGVMRRDNGFWIVKPMGYPETIDDLPVQLAVQLDAALSHTRQFRVNSDLSRFFEKTLEHGFTDLAFTDAEKIDAIYEASTTEDLQTKYRELSPQLQRNPQVLAAIRQRGAELSRQGGTGRSELRSADEEPPSRLVPLADAVSPGQDLAKHLATFFHNSQALLRYSQFIQSHPAIERHTVQNKAEWQGKISSLVSEFTGKFDLHYQGYEDKKKTRNTPLDILRGEGVLHADILIRHLEAMSGLLKNLMNETPSLAEELQNDISLLNREIDRIRMERMRIISGDLNARDQRTDLAGLIRGQENILKALAGESPIQIRVSTAVEDASPLVDLDAEKLMEVIKNLVKNAVEAIERSGKGSAVTVDLSVDSANRQLMVRVMDDGPGLPKEFQIGITTKSGEDGKTHGLGTLSAAEDIESMGGKIEFDTIQKEGIAAGTVVSIVLPLARSELRGAFEPSSIDYLDPDRINQVMNLLNAHPQHVLNQRELTQINDFLSRVGIEGETFGTDIDLIAVAALLARTEKAGNPRFIEERYPGILSAAGDFKVTIHSPRVLMEALGSGQNRFAYTVTVEHEGVVDQFYAKVDQKESYDDKESPTFKESKNYALLSQQFQADDRTVDLPFSRQWLNVRLDERWIQMGELIQGDDLEVMITRMASSVDPDTEEELNEEEIRALWNFSYALGQMIGDFYFGSERAWLPGDVKAANVVWDAAAERMVDIDYEQLLIPSEQRPDLLSQRETAENLQGVQWITPHLEASELAIMPVRGILEPLFTRGIVPERTLGPRSGGKFSQAQAANLFLAGFFEPVRTDEKWHERISHLRVTEKQAGAIKQLWAKKDQGLPVDPSDIPSFEDNGEWFVDFLHPGYEWTGAPLRSELRGDFSGETSDRLRQIASTVQESPLQAAFLVPSLSEEDIEGLKKLLPSELFDYVHREWFIERALGIVLASEAFSGLPQLSDFNKKIEARSVLSSSEKQYLSEVFRIAKEKAIHAQGFSGSANPTDNGRFRNFLRHLISRTPLLSDFKGVLTVEPGTRSTFSGPYGPYYVVLREGAYTPHVDQKDPNNLWKESENHEAYLMPELDAAVLARLVEHAVQAGLITPEWGGEIAARIVTYQEMVDAERSGRDLASVVQSKRQKPVARSELRGEDTPKGDTVLSRRRFLGLAISAGMAAAFGIYRIGFTEKADTRHQESLERAFDALRGVLPRLQGRDRATLSALVGLLDRGEFEIIVSHTPLGHDAEVNGNRITISPDYFARTTDPKDLAVLIAHEGIHYLRELEGRGWPDDLLREEIETREETAGVFEAFYGTGDSRYRNLLLEINQARSAIDNDLRNTLMARLITDEDVDRQIPSAMPLDLIYETIRQVVRRYEQQAIYPLIVSIHDARVGSERALRFVYYPADSQDRRVTDFVLQEIYVSLDGRRVLMQPQASRSELRAGPTGLYDASLAKRYDNGLKNFKQEWTKDALSPLRFLPDRFQRNKTALLDIMNKHFGDASITMNVLSESDYANITFEMMHALRLPLENTLFLQAIQDFVREVAPVSLSSRLKHSENLRERLRTGFNSLMGSLYNDPSLSFHLGQPVQVDHNSFFEGPALLFHLHVGEASIGHVLALYDQQNIKSKVYFRPSDQTEGVYIDLSANLRDAGFDERNFDYYEALLSRVISSVPLIFSPPDVQAGDQSTPPEYLLLIPQGMGEQFIQAAQETDLYAWQLKHRHGQPYSLSQSVVYVQDPKISAHAESNFLSREGLDEITLNEFFAYLIGNLAKGGISWEGEEAYFVYVGVKFKIDKRDIDLLIELEFLPEEVRNSLFYEKLPAGRAPNESDIIGNLSEEDLIRVRKETGEQGLKYAGIALEDILFNAPGHIPGEMNAQELQETITHEMQHYLFAAKWREIPAEEKQKILAEVKNRHASFFQFLPATYNYRLKDAHEQTAAGDQDPATRSELRAMTQEEIDQTLAKLMPYVAEAVRWVGRVAKIPEDLEGELHYEPDAGFMKITRGAAFGVIRVSRGGNMTKVPVKWPFPTEKEQIEQTMALLRERVVEFLQLPKAEQAKVMLETKFIEKTGKIQALETIEEMIRMVKEEIIEARKVTFEPGEEPEAVAALEHYAAVLEAIGRRWNQILNRTPETGLPERIGEQKEILDLRVEAFRAFAGGGETQLAQIHERMGFLGAPARALADVQRWHIEIMRRRTSREALEAFRRIETNREQTGLDGAIAEILNWAGQIILNDISFDEEQTFEINTVWKNILAAGSDRETRPMTEEDLQTLRMGDVFLDRNGDMYILDSIDIDMDDNRVYRMRADPLTLTSFEAGAILTLQKFSRSELRQTGGAAYSELHYLAASVSPPLVEILSGSKTAGDLRNVASALYQGISRNFPEFLEILADELYEKANDKIREDGREENDEVYIAQILETMQSIAAQMNAVYPDRGGTFVLSPTGDRTRPGQSETRSYTEAIERAGGLIGHVYYQGFVVPAIQEAVKKTGAYFQPVSNFSQLRNHLERAVLLRGDEIRRNVLMMQIGLIRPARSEMRNADPYEEAFAVFTQFVFGFVAGEELSAEQRRFLADLSEFAESQKDPNIPSEEILHRYGAQRGVDAQSLLHEIKTALIRSLTAILGEKAMILQEGLDLGSPNIVVSMIADYVKDYRARMAALISA